MINTLSSGLYFDLHVDYVNRQICVEGAFDAACAPNLATAVAGLQRACRGDIRVRLDDVTFIDMAGLGILVGATTSQRERGSRLVIAGVNPQVRRVFGLAGLTDLLPDDPA